MGCSTLTIKFFESYLTERKQYVEIKTNLSQYNTVKSDKLAVNVGLQQGSCLSPILYDIATYDLKDHLTHANSIQFADDFNISVVGNDIEDLNVKLKITISEIESWCLKKKLILHPEKSSLLHMHKKGSGQEPILCTIYNKQIQNVDSVRILGVMVQSDLHWEKHTDKMKNSINSANFALLSLRNIISNKNLLSVYYAYVYSILSFGIMFWGCDDKCIHSMFIIQKRSLRIINNFSPETSCRSHFKRLNLLTVPSIFIYACCVFKKQYPNLYNSHSDHHSYNTRNRDKVALPIHSSNLVANSPYYKSAVLYDHLPQILRNIKNVTFFKTVLKKLLIDREYYEVKVYMNDIITEKCILKFVPKNVILKYS